MISSREKGLFQLLIGLQIVAILALFWFLYFIILVVFIGNDQFKTYFEYSFIVVFAMFLEAFARPTSLKAGPGRMRYLAWAITRRQWAWVLVSITIMLVFWQDLRISRLFLAIFAVSAAVVLFLTNRCVMRIIGNLDLKHLRALRLRTFVLGPESWCETVVPEIDSLHSLLDVSRVAHTGAIHSEDNYATMISEQPVDLLVIPPRHLPDATVIHLLRLGDRLGFRCWMPIELTRTFGRRFDLQRVGRLDILTPPSEPLENTSNQLIKRLFDIFFSLIIIVTVMPWLCLFVKLIHRRQSPGPLFFRQDRVGKNGVTFQVYKFRTLHVDNGDESQQVTKGDSRVFPGGKFMRKTSIDEVPQFLNVLTGDMSVVGPRPHMEVHDFQFREIFERYGVRRYVKPGVTGLAQVKGFRGEVNRPKDLRHRARLDNFYVTHWDLALDVGIIAMTGISMIRPPRTAY